MELRKKGRLRGAKKRNLEIQNVSLRDTYSCAQHGMSEGEDVAFSIH